MLICRIRASLYITVDARRPVLRLRLSANLITGTTCAARHQSKTPEADEIKQDGDRIIPTTLLAEVACVRFTDRPSIYQRRFFSLRQTYSSAKRFRHHHILVVNSLS